VVAYPRLLSYMASCDVASTSTRKVYIYTTLGFARHVIHLVFSTLDWRVIRHHMTWRAHAWFTRPWDSLATSSSSFSTLICRVTRHHMTCRALVWFTRPWDSVTIRPEYAQSLMVTNGTRSVAGPHLSNFPELAP